MLDLRRLVILRELKQQGTMSAAARELSYTHSAVSQQLALLERETGVTLLERAGRSVRLTPAGEELVANTEAVLAALEKAESDLATAHERPQGVVRMAAFTTVSRIIVPDALRILHSEFPGLQVQVTRADPEFGVSMLMSRQVDMVLTDGYPGTEQITAPGISSAVLDTDPVRAYLPQTASGQDEDDVSRMSWVMEPYTSAATQWALRVCRERGFEPRVVHTSSDLLFHLRMVEKGLAAAFLPDMVVRESGVRLTSSEWLPSDQQRSIQLLLRTGSEAHPIHVAVGDAISRVLRTGEIVSQ
ncbi:MAG: LysR family transcriptional regulator [Leucobacter sp.]